MRWLVSCLVMLDGLYGGVGFVWIVMFGVLFFSRVNVRTGCLVAFSFARKAGFLMYLWIGNATGNTRSYSANGIHENLGCFVAI